MKNFIILLGLCAMLSAANAAPTDKETLASLLLSSLLAKGQDKTSTVQALLSALVQHDQEMDESNLSSLQGHFGKMKDAAEGEAASVDNPQLKETFSRIAGFDKEIDSGELQDTLTTSLRTGLEDIHHGLFSLEACKSIIAMLDVDKSYSLNYDEFLELMTITRQWKRLYSKYDDDDSGTIDRREVDRAVKSLGYYMSRGITDALFKRFTRHLSPMYIDDFFACLSRAKIMNDFFDQKSEGGTSIQLSKEDFFQFIAEV